eukprot:TRINITY_DN7998_c0_g2_i2.p1 TRINITY_DN7998_c0_g2~~TRINITY_DN7998_c0_g2_i2.p1  ORF type:complete len:136 (+),score=22.34 TRINITY_DN7998_c0_g2_i2:60-467(+)
MALILAVTVCYYAYKINAASQAKFQVVESTPRKQKTSNKLFILCLFCTITLLAQAIHLVATSIIVDINNLATVLSFTLIEICACGAVINIYGGASDFTKEKVLTTRSTTRTRLQKEVSLNYRMSKMDMTSSAREL